MPTADRPRYADAYLYGGVFALTFSALLFETSLTRIFSVTLWYHFAYFVVSLALFGLGGGGLVAFFFQGFFQRRLRATLIGAALFQCAAMAFALAWGLGGRSPMVLSLEAMARLTGLYLACALPFAATGLSMAVLLQNRRDRAPWLYAFDLFGSALACVLFIPAISHLSGPAVALGAAAMAAVAAVAFGRALGRTMPWGALAMAAALVGGLAVLWTSTTVFWIKQMKTYHERSDLMYAKWTPTARIAVYPGVFWKEDASGAFGWGISPKYQAEVRDTSVPQLWIEQDASAGTPITRFNGNFTSLEHLRYDVTALPYHLRPKGSALILGVGGGRDVLTALLFGARQVVGCDINAEIIDLVRNRYRDFAGDLYGRPDVDIRVGEARNLTRRLDEQFDVLQISLIDSWAATAAGAFTLSENNLYTVEAFGDYLDRLSDDGVLSVSRFLFQPRSQSLRVAVLARAALERRGVTEPGRHVAVLSAPFQDDVDVATILVARRPFDDTDLTALATIAETWGFDIQYLPGRFDDENADADPDFLRVLTAPDMDTAMASEAFDLSPSTDNRPFFFQMVPFSRAVDLALGRGDRDHYFTFNYFAQVVVLTLIVVAGALVTIFYVLPLALSRRTAPPPPAWGLYFVCLGVGFMFVEIPLLQKGALYLGHPSYSLSIVLSSMLVFAGLGSALSGRVATERLERFLMVLLPGVAALTLVVAWIQGPVLDATIGAALPIRAAVLVAQTGTLALAMGCAFPSGLRLLDRQGASGAIPWVWALNGGASVLGSILAMALAMAFGYRIVFLSGAAAYLAAALSLGLGIYFAQKKPRRLS